MLVACEYISPAEASQATKAIWLSPQISTLPPVVKSGLWDENGGLRLVLH